MLVVVLVVGDDDEGEVMSELWWFGLEQWEGRAGGEDTGGMRGEPAGRP